MAEVYCCGDMLMKFSDLIKSFDVPKAVQNAAKRGLELRKQQPPSRRAGLTQKEATKAGIHSGVAGARALASGRVSEEKVRRMVRYFARHAKDYKLDPGKKPTEDNGYLAGLLWGGEAGKRWAESIVEKLNRER